MKDSRWIIIIGFIFFLSLPGFGQEMSGLTLELATHSDVSKNTDRDARIHLLDSLLKEAAEKSQVNGAVGIILDDTVFYERCLGMANLEKGTPFTSKTAIEIASLSKQFTAAGILLLEQDGLIQAEDNVKMYLQESFPYQGITIKHLLTHTSGLPDYSEWFKENWEEPRPVDNLDILNYLVEARPPVLFEPGKAYKYSNTGYVILAEVVRSVSGKPLDEFLEERIFSKYPFQSAGFYERSRIYDLPLYAPSWHWDVNKGAYVRPETITGKEYIGFLSNRLGPGRLSLSLEDLYLWNHILDYEALLSEASKAKMFTPAEFEGVEMDYGYGFHNVFDEQAGHISYHTGSWGGNLTFIKKFHDLGLTIITLNNTQQSDVMKVIRTGVEEIMLSGFFNHSETLEARYPIVDQILNHEDGYYHIALEDYPEPSFEFPIGVFDSGTGGLAVLEVILGYDGFDNRDFSPGSDDLFDFEKEKFIFLADQANMPYGLYESEGKTELLVEHIFKDLHFLLSGKYYITPDSDSPFQWNKPIKALVIACNTATAYGKDHLEEFMDVSGLAIPVFGVIDAGAEGALELFETNESGSIGVLATVGTIASGGYEETIMVLKEVMDLRGEIKVYSQGGFGIAEAVDEEPDFVDRKRNRPRVDYRGPSLAVDNQFQIKKELLEVYDFDFKENRMLCDRTNPYACETMQINSAANYMRFHLVSLLEEMRNDPDVLPLKALIMGCTHYPYLKTEIQEILEDLYDYQNEGVYPYRKVMAEKVQLIDPAEKLSQELFSFLKQEDLLNPQKTDAYNRFFISVPNLQNQRVITDENGRFTYDYKYGRNPGEIQEYVKVVPFGKNNISEETLDRLRKMTPLVFREIIRFSPSINRN